MLSAVSQVSLDIFEMGQCSALRWMPQRRDMPVCPTGFHATFCRGALKTAHRLNREGTMSNMKGFVIVASVLVVSFGSITSQAQQAPPQSPTMTFFVTSTGPGKGADLGGLEGADRQCQTLAQSAGAGSKTWRAYLSTQTVGDAPAVNARDRIGPGPWQNFKGDVVAQSVSDLHGDNNKLSIQTSLTERGTMLPGVGYTPNYHDVLTGSQVDGRAFPTG